MLLIVSREDTEDSDNALRDLPSRSPTNFSESSVGKEKKGEDSVTGLVIVICKPMLVFVVNNNNAIYC
jgi:hypothetical protein